MRKVAIAAALIAAKVAAGPALAQDASLTPTYGTLTLPGNFAPDPRTVEVVAGGDRDAFGLTDNCGGRVPSAPTLRVVYAGGAGYPLVFRVTSALDTILVVKAPDGRLYCSDDAGDINPVLSFRHDAAGTYIVWVGKSAHWETDAPAIVAISEVAPRF